MGVSEIIALLGGVALFLFGMSLMGDSLKKVAGNKLELILYRLSSTPLKGILLGTGVTAVIQSSSATSVMVVGFVNSGMMKVRQAIGVIMGAILGTSITGWVIALSALGSGAKGWLSLLSTNTLASVFALVGIIFYMFSKQQTRRNVGGIMLGFAVLMFGMEAMSGAVSVLRTNEAFLRMLTDFTNPLLGILVGMVFTSILQSASAAVGILQALSATGAITFAVAFPLIMGIAIGAAVPVLLSAIGASAAGRKTAVSYLVVDLLGAMIVGSLFYGVSAVVEIPFLTRTMDTVSIALVNTAFRFLVVVLLAPFISALDKLVSLLIRSVTERPSSAEDMDRLEDRFIAHPALAVEQSRLTINSMAAITMESLLRAMELLDKFTPEAFSTVAQSEALADRYEDKLGTYLVKISQREMDAGHNKAVSKYLHAITDFERISDHALNLAENAREIHEKHIDFTPDGAQEINVLRAAIGEIADIALTSFITEDVSNAYRIEPLEEVIDNLCAEMKAHHVDRVSRGLCAWHHGFVFNDLLTNFERVADHCSNIGLAMIELEADAFDLHQYTASLMEVRSHSFDEYYREYSEKYQL